MMAQSALIPLYSRWMRESLGASFAPEPRATCADCAMCRPAPGGDVAPIFDPALKCCTYYPNLPNYLVGHGLREGSPRLRAQIAARRGLTPLGLDASPSYALRYGETAQHFGVDPALRCPYLDGD